MAKFAIHMGDPHGDPQTSPQHADPHGLGAFLKTAYKKSMWIGVLWAGLWVTMWITHVGGKFHHGVLEKSLNMFCFLNLFRLLAPLSAIQLLGGRFRYFLFFSARGGERGVRRDAEGGGLVFY